MDVLLEGLIGFINTFVNVITNKRPFVALLFPTSGLGSLYIPDTLINVQTSNAILDFINGVTPYLKFVFLLLTIILTILSSILQVRKLMSKDKKKDE